MERVSKRNYYLDIAQTVLERATCLRRVYGAIIVKNDEIISTGYLVGRDARSGELLHDATSCPMCRRMIINAGIDEVVIRRTEEEFDIVPVQKWIDEDDSL